MSKGITFTHGLNEDIALDVGERAALIFNRIAFWIDNNEAEGGNEFEGATYAKVPVSKLQERFKWLSERQVSNALKQLVEAGYLQVASDENDKPVLLHANKWDKARWYGLGPKTTVLPMSPNGHIEAPNSSNRNDQTVASYKDNTPLNTPLTHSTPPARKRTDLPRRVFEAWNLQAERFGLSTVRTNLKNAEREKDILRRLADCDGDETLLFAAIVNLTQNPFWVGRGEKIWRADFDWLFKRSQNFRKALEYTPAPNTETQNAKCYNPTEKQKQFNGHRRREIRSRVLEEFKNDGVSSQV